MVTSNINHMSTLCNAQPQRTTQTEESNIHSWNYTEIKFLKMEI